MRNSEKLIAELIAPAVEALKLQLWGIEHSQQGKYSVLRIFIESDAGIVIEDCEKVSRQVSAILDVEDPVSEEYTLEVSSPGLDRPLFTVPQFAQFKGNEVDIRLRTPLQGRRKFKGLITDIVDDKICVQVDGTEFQLAHAEIEKANIVY